MNLTANVLKFCGPYSLRDYLRVFVVALAYFLAHHLAFLFPDSEKIIMLVWPAGGVGLAAFLLNPRRLWLLLIVAFYISGIAADVFLGGRSLLTGLGYMTGNMVESVGCAWVIIYGAREFQGFRRVQEVLALFFGVVFVNALSSCIGAGTSVLTRGAVFFDAWRSWYIADGLGVLLVAPFLVAWLSGKDLLAGLGFKKMLEGIALMATWVFFSWCVFLPQQNVYFFHPYFLVGLLAWPALRFGQAGVTLALMVLFLMSVNSPAIMHGPSPLDALDFQLDARLLELQLFMGFLAAGGYLLAASKNEVVAAQAALKSSERRFAQLIENSFDNIVVLDAEGIQRYVSKSVERTLGYQPAELLDISVMEQMIHPDDLQTVKAAFSQIIKDGHGGGIQYRHRHKAGGWVDLEAWGTNQLNNPDIRGVVFNCHVITERKKAEDALRKAKEDAERANKAKSEFLNNIAHDFRTPMQSIMGFSDFLQAEQLTERQKKCAHIINEKSTALLSLVEDLLDVSRLESGGLELRSIEFDLRKSVQSAVAMAEEDLIGKDVKVFFFVDENIPRLMGDEVRFNQIMSNLIGNAVKYTDKGSITVRVNKVGGDRPGDGCRVRVSVKDTGLGISRDKQAQIFDAFTRFHEFAGGKERGGVGLGLYIVKTLVDLMKGTVSVVSDVGVGTEFILTFDFDMARQAHGV
ncbi:MAG: PAS domain S-box protein [Candidatus Omnitrophica bacterium]|nr:PAS domain S-box protein [Candidatus Omnitrophota bacterium]